jgi:hypothetical protein
MNPHEKWMDERQGPARRGGHGVGHTDRRERNEYHARGSWEGGNPEEEYQAQRRFFIERDLINDQGEENLCSKN